MGKRGLNSGMSGNSFKSFSDKADDTGMRYNDDSKETVEFFKNNSNFDELTNKMSYDELNDFREWTSGRFMFGQQYDGWDAMDERDKEITQTYDDVLDKSTLKQGVIVTRLSDAQFMLGKGNKIASLDELQFMEGNVITSKANLSFAAASEGLTIGASGKNVEYRLKIPGGTKGAGMWIGDERLNGWGADQREFMMNRDVAYKVGKTTYDSKRKVYTVNLEYIARTQHDYGTSGRVTTPRVWQTEK